MTSLLPPKDPTSNASGPPVEGPASDREGAGPSVHNLYVRYAPLLRHLALRRFRIPREDVDALVHDVFATYLSDPTTVRSIRPYLIGGICNASRQYWRRRDRHDELREGTEEPVDAGMLEHVAMRVDVAMALARIGKRCREALRRYYLEGESTPAIAAVLETTPNNVLYLLHVCRKRARAALDTNSRCI